MLLDKRKVRVAAMAVFSVCVLGGAAAGAAEAPSIPYGVQTGDVTVDGAVVWSRADRPARMIVEYAFDADFADAKRIVGPAALPETDLTARVAIEGLPAGTLVHYRVSFQDLADITTASAPVTGSFKTAPADRSDVSFVWSGDTAGQGWGINTEWGGMKIYKTMLADHPDFFLHNGDTIYADGPIKPEVKLADGTVWRNITTPAKSKVAETLAEFRGAYAYNLMDDNLRAFNAAVPMFAQWDDHETLNNWYPQEMLNADDRYSVKSAALLSARAKRAFFEYMPIRWQEGAAPETVFRSFAYGPMMDMIMVDMRTYRGPNSANRQPVRGPETEFLGAEQLHWLKTRLLESKATWKVIASDMPIGLLVRDGKENFENLANGDGPALGRELEMADLLTFIRDNDIKNVVWLTADVHYTAAHYYDPAKAQYAAFAPFWEFVSGPLNAGTFGPNAIDNTFGPQVVFQKAPESGRSNLPPSEGMQFYGKVTIAGKTGVMTVELKDLAGATLYSVDLKPEV